MKYILDASLQDDSLRLYGFQENKGYDTSLANNTLFIDIDGKIYYSDIASTFSGAKIKHHLYLGETKNFSIANLEKYTFEKERKYITLLEESLYRKVS